MNLDKRAPTEKQRRRLQAGGTLHPRRHVYIERPEDDLLVRLLSRGQYVSILQPRQTGKSSLMVRTAHALNERGVKSVIIDLAGELGTPRDASEYFLGLLSKIANDLEIELYLPAWWTSHTLSDLQSALNAFFS